MDTLGKLFGSQARVKILRLFLLNPLEVFDAVMVAEKSKVRIADVRRELSLLRSTGLVADKVFTKEIASKNGGEKTRTSSVKTTAGNTKKRVQGYQLKTTFPFLVPLKNLIFAETPLGRTEISNCFKGVGKIKLLAISGIFLDEIDSRVDLLIVGDNLKRRSIENALRSIEAEIGKELSYGAFETADFLYRVSVYDKFVRDILDFRHERVIDKLGVE